MLELLIMLLVVLLIFAVVYFVSQAIPLPPPFNQIALAVLMIIFLIVPLYLVCLWYTYRRGYDIS